MHSPAQSANKQKRRKRRKRSGLSRGVRGVGSGRGGGRGSRGRGERRASVGGSTVGFVAEEDTGAPARPRRDTWGGADPGEGHLVVNENPADWNEAAAQLQAAMDAASVSADEGYL